MEFWLTFNSLAEKLQFPVPPPQFTIQKGNIIHTLNINNAGEIALIGKRKLASIEIASFFPKQEYSFCQYSGFPAPYECVKMIERWRNSGRPMRLIITGTDINMACCIENFTYGERDASGDVYFTLSLKEYRFLKNEDPLTALGASIALQLPQTRPVDKQQPATYAVKEGDTLPIIAKKVYGDSSRYTDLASKNKIKDYKSIYPGQVLLI